MGRHTLEYILFVKFNTNNIWYSLPAKRATVHHFGSSLCKAQRFTLLSLCWKCFLIKRKKEKNSKAYFQQYFSDNQICELIHAILQLTDTHAQFYTHERKQTHLCIHMHTHTHRPQTDIFWMLIICLLLHPAWKRWRERGRKTKRESVREQNDRRAFFIISFCIALFVFISLPLSPYISKWIPL